MMAEMTIAEALRRAHIEAMSNDETVILMGEDLSMGVFGVSSGLDDMFGKGRVINTPISETAFVGMGIGAAMTGLRPIVEVMFCDFMGVCFDQIMNQAAKVHFMSDGQMQLPLTIRTTMGAGDGSGAMHSQSLHGLLQQIPGLIVACPSTPSDAAGLLMAAVKADTPVILMEHKGLYNNKGQVGEGFMEVPFGKGRVARKGTDITLVAASRMCEIALEASDILAKYGISLEIIDPRTISPLDTRLIGDSIRKTGRLMVVDEGAAIAGFADHIVSHIAENHFDCLKTNPRKIVPPHVPVPYGVSAEKHWLPDVRAIVEAAKDMQS